MAITTLDGYIAAAKQKVELTKTQTATTVGTGVWHTMFDRSGSPGAGSLSLGNTANGLVPTDATTGFPLINAFGGGATGYFTIADVGNTVAGRVMIYDRLFHVGSISLTATGTTTLTSIPSYSGRVPGGSDYTGLELWFEINAAVANTAVTVSVTYTNQSGTAARSTGATAGLNSYITGRMQQLPLQAGDSGVQQVTAVVVGGSAAATGSVNIIVARPLLRCRMQVANDAQNFGLDKTGMPVIFTDSALAIAVCPDSTSSGTPSALVEIANG